MPVLPVTISATIGALQGQVVSGLQSVPIATAFGTAVGTWALIPTSIMLTGATTGTAGIGKVTGLMTLAPNPSPYIAALSGMTISGIQIAPLATALSIGAASGFSTGIYNGITAGVGIGGDTTKVTGANPATLIPLLQASFAGMGQVGLASSTFCTALATAVANHVLFGTGVGIVTGVPAPAPGVSTSTSTLVI